MDSATALAIVAAVALSRGGLPRARGRKPQLADRSKPPRSRLPQRRRRSCRAESRRAPARKRARSTQQAERRNRRQRAQSRAAAKSRTAAPKPPATAAAPAREADSVAHEQNVAAIRQGLANTRGGFIARLAKLFGGKQEIDKGLLEEIEEVLITADLGVRTTERILNELRDADAARRAARRGERVGAASARRRTSILDVGARPIKLESKPAVMLMVGVNGVGKTTTIGKLASRYVAAGQEGACSRPATRSAPRPCCSSRCGASASAARS